MSKNASRNNVHVRKVLYPQTPETEAPVLETLPDLTLWISSPVDSNPLIFLSKSVMVSKLFFLSSVRCYSKLNPRRGDPIYSWYVRAQGTAWTCDWYLNGVGEGILVGLSPSPLTLTQSPGL